MKKLGFLFLLIGTFVMIVVMTKTGATLKTPNTPKGILDLEFAYNSTKTTAVLSAWASTTNSNNILAAKNNTYLDFIFLFFYSLFLFYSCKKIAQQNNSRIGFLIAKGALLAGVLDIVENVGMLATLSNHTSNAVACITTSFSVVKWILALLAVAYLLKGLITAAINKKLKSLLA